jgi:hypothetical protein
VDAKILNVHGAPQPRIEQQIPSRVVIVVVHIHTIALPFPIAAAVQIVIRHNPVRIVVEDYAPAAISRSLPGRVPPQQEPEFNQSVAHPFRGEAFAIGARRSSRRETTLRLAACVFRIGGACVESKPSGLKA